MYWTIPLNPNTITMDEYLQDLQKYMMISKPDIQEEKDGNTDERTVVPEEREKTVVPEDIHLESTKKDSISHKNKNYFTPSHQDSLFWCLFLAKYSYKDYINAGCQHGRKEIEEKTRIAEFVGKKKNKLTEDLDHKITNVFCQEMVTDLLTKPTMPLSSIYGFCSFYECSFLIINEQEKVYLSFLYKKNSKPFHIYMRNNKYSIDLDFTQMGCDTLKEDIADFVSLHHYEKPLRAISSYTKKDLEEIAEKINFEIPEKMKKNELYEALWKKLAWMK